MRPYSLPPAGYPTRTIIPITKQPDLSTTSDDTWGLGDINMSFFVSPKKSEGIIWGLGPVVQFSTGTDEVLSSRKWAAGPTGVGLVIHGPWVVGLLANNRWSFAGNDDCKDVSQFIAQYFVNYNLPDGWYLTSAPIITANWKAEGEGSKWTVPIGGGFGKVFRIGKLPFNGNVSAYSKLFVRVLARIGPFGFNWPCYSPNLYLLNEDLSFS